MPNPAWFFSTLAQATAAIVGFFIALATVIYQLERAEKRSKTEDLRDSYREFRDFYVPHFSVLSHHLLALINERLPDRVAESQDLDERRRELLNGDFDMPHTIYLWSLVRDINHILESIGPAAEPENYELLNQEELEQLENLLTEYQEYFSEGTSRVGGEEYLVNELSSEHGVDWGDIVGVGDLTPLFHDYETISETFQVDIEREYFESYTSIASFNGVCIDLMLSIQGKKHEMRNTILDEDPWLEPFFKKSMALTVVGVVLPIIALISPPVQIVVLQGGALVAYQTLLIFASVTLMAMLILDLRNKIE